MDPYRCLISYKLPSMTCITTFYDPSDSVSFYELIRFKIQKFPSPSCNMLLCPICSMGSMAARICIYDSYLLILWHVYSINCNIWPSMTLYYCLLWPIWLLFAFFVGFYAEEILFPARASSLLFLSVMFFFSKYWFLLPMLLYIGFYAQEGPDGWWRRWGLDIDRGQPWEAPCSIGDPGKLAKMKYLDLC